MKNNLLSHNLCVADATELALDRPLWGLLAATGAMQCTEMVRVDGGGGGGDDNEELSLLLF